MLTKVEGEVGQHKFDENMLTSVQGEVGQQKTDEQQQPCHSLPEALNHRSLHANELKMVQTTLISNELSYYFIFPFSGDIYCTLSGRIGNAAVFCSVSTRLAFWRLQSLAGVDCNHERYP